MTTSAPDDALVVTDLVRRFGALRAVDGLSFSVPRGALVTLLGPNGAGKTSTLDVCTGFARPDAGAVTVLGLDSWRQSAALRPRIGVMLQAGGAHAAARAGEMLEVIARCSARPLDPAWLLETPRPAGTRPDPGPAAVRRPGAAAEPGDGAGRPARTAVPGRAHRRDGPAGPASGLGPVAGGQVRRGDDPADHPPAGRGRAAGRPGGDHRPRPGRRRRFAGRAHRAVRTASSGSPQRPGWTSSCSGWRCRTAMRSGR